MLLSNRTQARIIARLLRGEELPAFAPDDLVGEWREYYNWILVQPEQPVDTRIHQWFMQFAQRGENDLLNARLLQREIDAPWTGYPAIDATIELLPDLTWLWHGWLPRGQIGLMVGDPSAGKSYFALDLARRVVAGEEMPDGSPAIASGPVLYVDAENRPMVLKGRLGPWRDEERARFYYMLPQEGRMMINFDYEDDTDRFLDTVYEVRPLLIIIDSFGSISLHGENAKEDVQRLLSFLTRVSRDYDCGLLLLHHLRKKSTLQLALPGFQALTIHSVRGSGHIAAMATNVLGMQLVGADQNGPRSLAVLKNNLGVYPDPLGVTFESWDEDPDVAVLRYGEAPQPDRKPKRVEMCMEWLVALLSEQGAVALSDILDMAEEAGYGERMVHRARERLCHDIADTLGSNQRGNAWQLADHTQDENDEDQED